MSLDKVHKNVLNSVLGRANVKGSPAGGENEIAERDSAVRQAVSDLYMALSEHADANQAIDILATHTAMLVEMINEFKTKR